jgi:putative aldouronate transport system substrate-binding protein
MSVNPTVVQPNTFAITSSNRHPEATMRWVDYFYSRDGSVLLDWGVEDVTYVADAKGIWDFKRDDQDDPLSKAVWDPASTSNWPNKGTRGVWTPFHGGRIPILWSNESFERVWRRSPIAQDPNVIKQAESLDAYDPYFPKEVWRGLSFTAEDSQVVSDYTAGTGQYIGD